MEKDLITAEDITYWFFRLNGCLTIRNFLIHPDNGSDAITDADLVAVRFPHRIELENARQGKMKDHALFNVTKPTLFYVEVKAGLARINHPWKNDDVLEEMLKRVGAFNETNVEYIAKKLRDNYSYEGELFDCKVIVLCGCKNDTIPQEMQLTFEDIILPFIYKRLRTYRKQKANHQQWEKSGKSLFNASKKSEKKFIETLLASSGITTNSQLK